MVQDATILHPLFLRILRLRAKRLIAGARLAPGLAKGLASFKTTISLIPIRTPEVRGIHCSEENY
jgi:hypothetical protein